MFLIFINFLQEACIVFNQKNKCYIKKKQRTPANSIKKLAVQLIKNKHHRIKIGSKCAAVRT